MNQPKTHLIDCNMEQDMPQASPGLSNVQRNLTNGAREIEPQLGDF